MIRYTRVGGEYINAASLPLVINDTAKNKCINEKACKLRVGIWYSSLSRSLNKLSFAKRIHSGGKKAGCCTVDGFSVCQQNIYDIFAQSRIRRNTYSRKSKSLECSVGLLIFKKVIKLLYPLPLQACNQITIFVIQIKLYWVYFTFSAKKVTTFYSNYNTKKIIVLDYNII